MRHIFGGYLWNAYHWICRTISYNIYKFQWHILYMLWVIAVENRHTFFGPPCIHIAYICCHELPRSDPSCCFAHVWGEGRVRNTIPPIFSRQWCVFSVVSPRNSLSAMFIYFFPYPLLILKSQLSWLIMTCDLILNIMTSEFSYVPQRLYSLSHIRIEMRSMNRALFLGHSRSMACYASNKHFIFYRK